MRRARRMARIGCCKARSRDLHHVQHNHDAAVFGAADLRKCPKNGPPRCAVWARINDLPSDNHGVAPSRSNVTRLRNLISPRSPCRVRPRDTKIVLELKLIHSHRRARAIQFSQIGVRESPDTRLHFLRTDTRLRLISCRQTRASSEFPPAQIGTPMFAIRDRAGLLPRGRLPHRPDPGQRTGASPSCRTRRLLFGCRPRASRVSGPVPSTFSRPFTPTRSCSSGSAAPAEPSGRSNDAREFHRQPRESSAHGRSGRRSRAVAENEQGAGCGTSGAVEGHSTSAHTWPIEISSSATFKRFMLISIGCVPDHGDREPSTCSSARSTPGLCVCLIVDVR